MIDLRSDTVTKPSAAMRSAMAQAEVGDDVYRDDLTVQKLEARVAEMAGKEAGLFVPSGTMGNQICLRLLAGPGNEVLVHENAHVIHYEAGATAAINGLSLCPLQGEKGIFRGADIENHLRPLGNVHYAPSSVVVVENTSNRGGGSVWPIESVREVSEVAQKHNLKIHLDGARIWNAMAATGISLAEWASPFDTLTVCFSKGLGAPVGSVIVSDKERIETARRYRKMLGGGMRQVGILAAACDFALEYHLPALKEDHEKAEFLALELDRLGVVQVESLKPETNMVFFKTGKTDAWDLLPRQCAEENLLFSHTTYGRYRIVTHRDVSMEDMKKSAQIISRHALS